MSRPVLKPALSLPPPSVQYDNFGGNSKSVATSASEFERKEEKMAIDRVCSEPIAIAEKEVVNMRLRRSTDVFDLDMVKRREQKVKASASIMESKNRGRVRKAFLNVFMFPLHLSWWRKRVPSSRDYLLRLSMLYFVHGISVVRELVKRPSETPVEFVELTLPFVLLVVLSVLMGQAATVVVAPGKTPENTDGPAQTETQSQTKKTKDGHSRTPSVTLDEVVSAGGSFRGKPRKLRRKPSKSESTTTAGNDSTNELFNEDDDDERTVSSDSDESDSSSDSSLSDSKPIHHRPQVAVRRSSLLGMVPPANATSAPFIKGTHESPIGSSKSPQHTNTFSGEVALSRASTLNASRSGGAAITSPSPTNGAGRSSGNRKPRFWPSRLVKHNTEPIPPTKEASGTSTLEVESDSDDENEAKDAEDDDENEKYASMLSTDNEDVQQSLLRNRFLSHSMEDLLDTVKSVHWSVHGPEKVLLTPGQIRAELERKIFEVRMNDSFRQFALAGAILVSIIPILFRTWLFGTAMYCKIMTLEFNTLLFDVPPQCVQSQGTQQLPFFHEAQFLFSRVFGTSFFDIMGVLTSATSNFVLSWVLLGHVAGATETFKRRHLYAKYFTKLTSSRKARRVGLPYFRLHKVDHIKAWLSLRSRRIDLDRETIGPYRASDTVTHHLFMVAIFLVGVVAFRAVQHLSNPNGKHQQNPVGMVPSTLGDWLLVAWAFVLAVFVQRIMALASKTHEKFQNTSVLLTEELNIHMRLLRKPEKKDELNACNQMLKVASALIKELEGNKSKKGQGGAIVLDPWLYSIVRVVLLSALGALSGDLFGFRVRLWKI